VNAKPTVLVAAGRLILPACRVLCIGAHSDGGALSHLVAADKMFEGDIAAEGHSVAALPQGLPGNEAVAVECLSLDLQLVARNVSAPRGRPLPSDFKSTVSLSDCYWIHNCGDG